MKFSLFGYTLVKQTGIEDLEEAVMSMSVDVIQLENKVEIILKKIRELED